MVTRNVMLGLLCSATLLFSACQKENLGSLSNSEQISRDGAADECPPVVKDLKDVNTVVDPNTGVDPNDLYGTISVTDQGTDLLVEVTAKTGYYIQTINVAYGTQADVNSTVASWQPCSGSGQFNAFYNYNDFQTYTSFTIPESMLDENGCIWLAANVGFISVNSVVRCTYGYPADQPNVNEEWKGTFQFCRCLPPPPPPGCGQLRTQTPGGWGAPANGNNPGAYLHANFATSFPTGVTLGDAAGFTASWTTAQSITDYLPAGGNASVLSANYTNPTTNQLKNNLVNHLLALTLSVTFDGDDVDFGDGGTPLADMEIASGPFAGWTVADFLVEANKVLGGTSSAFTANEVKSTAGAINENYVDGNIDNGFLVCP